MSKIGKERLETLQQLEAEIEDTDGGDKLTEWQHNFITDQFKRMEEYGVDMFMSDKQWAQVEKILELYNLENTAPEKPFHEDIDDDIPF